MFRTFHLGWKKCKHVLVPNSKVPLSKQYQPWTFRNCMDTLWGMMTQLQIIYYLRQKAGWISRKFIFSEGKRYLSLTDVVRNWLLLILLRMSSNSSEKSNFCFNQQNMVQYFWRNMDEIKLGLVYKYIIFFYHKLLYSWS